MKLTHAVAGKFTHAEAGHTRLRTTTLKVGLALAGLVAFACPASAADILFVSDGTHDDTTIPFVLAGAGASGAINSFGDTVLSGGATGDTVTIVINDLTQVAVPADSEHTHLDGSGDGNGDYTLSDFCAIFWSAAGNAPSGSPFDHHPDTRAALEAYVTGGGYVFVTGYRSIFNGAGDADGGGNSEALVAFLGGTGAVESLSASTTALNSTLSAAAGGTVLTTGVTNIQGGQPTGGADSGFAPGSFSAWELTGATGTTVSTGPGGDATWHVRALGTGFIAYVSNGKVFFSGFSDGQEPTWLAGNSQGDVTYNAALLNFAFNAAAACVPPVVDTDSDGIPDANELLGQDAAGVVHGFGATNINLADSDGDNLDDPDEIDGSSNLFDGAATDPNDADSDNDNIEDDNESAGQDNSGVVHGFGATNPNAADTDSDTLNDDDEIAGTSNSANPKAAMPFRTDPNDSDSDNDLLNDGAEVGGALVYGIHGATATDPNDPDTDGDNLSDGSEFNGTQNPFQGTSPGDDITGVGAGAPGAATDPCDVDSDGDTVNDDEEVAVGSDGFVTNPNVTDTDNGGVADNVEIDTDITDPNAAGDDVVVVAMDSDLDGLDDSVETAGPGAFAPTNTMNRDSDGDGVEDGVEVANGTDPNDPGDPAVATDTDGDGIPDSSDPFPNNPDNDGNGINDGWDLVSPGSDIGDPDTDGDTDFSDVMVIVNNVFGAAVYDPNQDIDRDGDNDAVDYVLLINRVFFGLLIPTF